MTQHRCRTTTACSILFIAAALAAPVVAFAQDRQPPRQGGGGGGNRPAVQHPQVLKAYVADQSRKLELELADLIQRRAATRASDLPGLDLQIDARILTRWLTQQILNAEPMSDTQAVTWLRHRDLQALCTAMDAAVAKQAGREPAKAQQDAMKAINKATFALPPEIDSSAGIDALLQPLRGPLAALVAEAGKPVDMRPAATPSTAPATQQTTTAPVANTAAPLTLDQIGGRVTQLSLSPALRQQLLAATAAAKKAQGEEQSVMTDMLRRALETIQSLQADVSVDPTARADLETKLGQAVTLYSDARLRDAAEKHFDDLNRYRESAAKMTALNLPRDKMQSLAPVFAYARNHPNDQAKLLDALTKFVTLDKEMAEVKVPATTVLGARQLDAQLKAYAAARETFLAECENLGGAAGAAFGGSADANAIPTRAEELERAAEMVRILQRLPQTQTRLLTLKPRPTGALEKRLVQTLVKTADNNPTAKADAQTLLVQVDEIAAAWGDAQEATSNPIEPEAFKALAGRAWPEIEVGLRTTATELTTAIAAGQAPDAAKLNTLRRSKALLAEVRKIVDLRASLAAATALPRWADCTLTQQKVDALLEYHRSDYGPVLAAALQGEGDEKALKQQQQRYRGFLATLGRVADRSKACEALPEDPVGLVGRITTPSEKAPHQTVRFLSYVSDLIDFARAAPEVDMSEVTQLQDQMLTTLNRMSR